MTLTAAEAFDRLDEIQIPLLLKILERNEYIERREISPIYKMSYDDIEMERACSKIVNGRLRLSNEDEDLIKSVANKL